MYNMITGMWMDDKDEIEKARQLTNIELAEVSLVNKGANKKKFLFYKNADGDELDSLLSILDSAQFDSDSDIVIAKALDVLTNLEAGERTAIAKTIMAILKLADVDIDDETQVQKININSLKWPSFHSSPSLKVQKTEVDDNTLWPSIVGVA